MQIDVGSLITKVQSLVEDPTGQWCTKDYLTGVINLKWDDLSTELSMLNLGYDDVIAVVPVPAGLADLSQYQAPGQPLANMIRPKYVEWKRPESPDTAYDDADPVDRLSDVDDQSVGISEYTFRLQTIQITPSVQPVTARVTFIVMNVTLIDETQSVISGCQNVLAYRIAAKVGALVGNAGIVADNRADGDAAMSNFEELCVRLQQRNQRRFARTTNRGRRGLYPVTFGK